MPADTKIDLQGILRLTTDYARTCNWDDSLLMLLNLVLEELAVNVHEHARGRNRRFEVTIQEEYQGRVRLDFRDNGEPFDPLTNAPPPDLTSDALGRIPGGLGIHLVRSLAADAAYRRENNRNVLSLLFDNPPPES